MYDQHDPYGGPPSEQASDAHRMEKTAKLPGQKNFKKWPIIGLFVLMCLGSLAFVYWRQNAKSFSFSFFTGSQQETKGIGADRNMLGLDQKAPPPDLGVTTTQAPPQGGAPASTLPPPTDTETQAAATGNQQQDNRPGWQKRRPDFSFKQDKNWAMWQYTATKEQRSGGDGSSTQSASPSQHAANEAYDEGEMAEDSGQQQGSGGGGNSGKRGGAQGFYNSGNQRGGNHDGLDHKYSFQPELKGCVLKASTRIKVQAEDTLEATLPGEVTLKTFDPVWGKRFLRGGRVERCLWAPPASTMTLKANVQGIERGQVRVQVCATRLDKNGGGRINLGCMAGYDLDGSSGLRAEADRDWSGALTGLMFEAGLSGFDAFGNSIGGGDSSPVTVALGSITQGAQGIGREFIYEELRKPAKLTVRGGNVFYIKANADISDIPQTR